MKNCLIISFILLLSLEGFGQEFLGLYTMSMTDINKYYNYDFDLVRKTKIKSVFIKDLQTISNDYNYHTYNANGYLSAVLTKYDTVYWVDSLFYNSSQLISEVKTYRGKTLMFIDQFTYSKTGKILKKTATYISPEKLETIDDTHSWWVAGNRDYTYDANDNLINIDVKNIYGDLLFKDTTINVYDRENHLVQMESYDILDKSNKTKHIKYFTNGKVTLEFNLREGGTINSVEHYAYNDSGLVNLHKQDYYDEYRSSDMFIDEFRYNNNKKVTEVYYSHLGDVGDENTIKRLRRKIVYNEYNLPLRIMAINYPDDKEASLDTITEFYYEYPDNVSYYSALKTDDSKEVLNFIESVNKKIPYQDSSVYKTYKCFYNNLAVWLIKEKEWKYYFLNDTFVYAQRADVDQYFFKNGKLVQFKKERKSLKDTNKTERINFENDVKSRALKARQAFNSIKPIKIKLGQKTACFNSKLGYEITLTREEIKKLDSICFDNPFYKIKGFILAPICRGSIKEYVSSSNKFTPGMKECMLDNNCSNKMYIERVKYSVKAGKASIIETLLFFRKD